MAQTISKHIGEGFGKGDLYAALAYDTSDNFGGMRIKGLYIAPPSGSGTALQIGSCTTGINFTDGGGTGIDFNGTWTGHCISIGDTSTPLTTATNDRRGIYIKYTYTGGTGQLTGIFSFIKYTPATSGYASPIGLYGIASIDGSFTGGAAYPVGVRGQLQFTTNANINAAGSTLTALTAVMTDAGSPTFTAGHIYGLYIDNQINGNVQATAGQAFLMRMANNGTASWDSALALYGPRVNNFVVFDSCEASTGCLQALAADVASDNTSYKLRIQIDGTTYYLAVWSNSAWS